MIFYFLKKLLTSKRLIIAFLPLLIIFVISLLIDDYNNMPDPEKVKSHVYVCGKFGDKQMRIDRRYLFLARVEYQDVNYWGKNITQEHNAKGCNDQIQSATFKVKWPEMIPSEEGYRLSSNKVNDITFSLNQRSLWRNDSNDKALYDYEPLLKHYLSEQEEEGGKDIHTQEINAVKVFNPNLALYQIDLKSKDNISKKIFWQEEKGRGMSVVIKCTYFIDGATLCELTSHVPNYGSNTSYLNIKFHGELLKYWEEIQRDSLKLINSYTEDK